MILKIGGGYLGIFKVVGCKFKIRGINFTIGELLVRADADALTITPITLDISNILMLQIL